MHFHKGIAEGESRIGTITIGHSTRKRKTRQSPPPSPPVGSVSCARDVYQSVQLCETSWRYHLGSMKKRMIGCRLVRSDRMSLRVALVSAGGRTRTDRSRLLTWCFLENGVEEKLLKSFRVETWIGHRDLCLESTRGIFFAKLRRRFFLRRQSERI